jgi:hypothetical protein
MDGACGIDVYGNHGVAVGDIDSDGFDDLYVCQPSGCRTVFIAIVATNFPGRDRKIRVDVLDNTACALFADFGIRACRIWWWSAPAVYSF